MITQATPISVLYTAALNGRLDALPRLSTRIKQERLAADSERNTFCLLFDLGQSCLPSAWICNATGGRGMLVAMDGMGYDAFHIGPRDVLYTMPVLVNQIRQVVATPFAAGPWSARAYKRGMSFLAVNAVNLSKLTPAEREADDMVIALRMSDTPHVEVNWQEPGRVLILDCGDPGEGPILGRLDLILTPTPPYILIEGQTRLEIPHDLNPDPTITGVIEFVHSEALSAERRRGQP